MKNTLTLSLENDIVRQCMQTYFFYGAPLLCCRANDRRKQLSDKLLHLILDIYDAGKYYTVCQQIILATDAMHTAADEILLNMSGTPVVDGMKCYFDMKAEALRQPELPVPMTMEADLLPQLVRRSGALGVAWALRMSACLNYLEVDYFSSRANALHIFKMLAYTGDEFAMRAVEYAMHATGDHVHADLWNKARQLFEAADRQFFTIIPPSMLSNANPDAADLALLILSIRTGLQENNGRLSLPMLQYATDSHDHIHEKIRNLCGKQALFQLKLLQQQQSAGKQYGF